MAFEQGRKGVQQVQVRRVQEAVRSFERAEDLDSSVPILTISWNLLCWEGSLGGSPGEVIEACNRAVESAPHHGNILDSRGVARALTGDRRGAIQDFEFFIQWAERFGVFEELIEKRKMWIEKLRAGEDPIDEAKLEELREE